jgi:hypothetical protein
MYELASISELGSPEHEAHQVAIARGVGLAALAGSFSVLSAVISGGRTPKQVLIPALLGSAFWGTVIGLSIYFDHRGR